MVSVKFLSERVTGRPEHANSLGRKKPREIREIYRKFWTKVEAGYFWWLQNVVNYKRKKFREKIKIYPMRFIATKYTWSHEFRNMQAKKNQKTETIFKKPR